MTRSYQRRGFLAAGIALSATTLAACSKTAQDAPETKVEPAAAPSSAAVPASASAPASASTASDVASVAAPVATPDTIKVSIQTVKGEIVLLLEAKKAPITVENFLKYVDAHKLEGAVFWRAANSGPSGFVQATMKGPTFPPIPHESTKKTGLTHTSGAISMSRFAPGTATADFVICVGDNTFMDAGREGSEDKLGYAAFGHVIKGMGVVRSILAGRIDKHTAEGGWAGQMLAKPVGILSAERLS